MATRGSTTGFKIAGGVDLGNVYISREYLIDVYPNLIPSSKAPGLFIWGRGNEGQLGLTDATSRSSPVQVGSYTSSWKQVAAGNNFTIAVKTDGTLWSWGSNSLAMLGQNDLGGDRSSPTQIGTLTNWKQVACGRVHAFAVKTDGTLWGWGENEDGQIGQNTRGILFRYSSPVQVGVGTDWRFVACGWEHTLAIKTDGTLWAWGQGSGLGIGSAFFFSRSSPVQVGTDTDWEMVAGGPGHSMGIKSNSTLWAWGSGGQGQLGLNNLGSWSTPQAVGGGSWKDVVCGFQTTAAIKSDGSLWAWGNRLSLYLTGLGFNNRSSPVQVGSDYDNKQVAAQLYHYFVIRTDGTIAYWGENQDGQLGRNNTVDLIPSDPFDLDTGTTWKYVACGHNHTVAIKDAGF